MTRGYKQHPSDTINPEIHLSFAEWRQQRHTILSTNLAEGWPQAREARRRKLQARMREAMEKKREKCKQSTNQPEPRYDEVYHEGLAWLDDLEDTEDEILYSTLDYFPGEPESSPKCWGEGVV
jgi:hypothetical protein